MEELFNQAKEFMSQNPHFGYLIGSIVFFIFSIGNFKKWNWAVSPSGYSQRWWYNFLGEKYFSTIMGILFSIGAIASFLGFYLSN